MEDSIWVISYGETSIRLLIATALGGLIGWERERNNHPAGFRTHILVCVGSTLIMLISIYGFAPFMAESQVRFSPDRIAAQVVSGIGFLGAGTILRQGYTVSGLTTAASLWVVAGIGLAVGCGLHFEAALTTVIALISLELLNRAEGILFHRRRLKVVRIQAVDQPGLLGELATAMGQMEISIRQVQVDEGGESEVEIIFTLRFPPDKQIPEMIEAVRGVSGVKSVHVD
ncbi:MgtC/SapB family protein [Desmospora activa]|uniref:Putative Mg2+ transporter-C (MgtC) family protein n=1 Tax=Desmospora activa DSM 45169 TaxID=1121389 RepID=A0A2T4Z1T3_9BACL|nr:MgtC/SapB family protein [Desmospora activa]PTM54735.1 putative Mg2+ transporter-C (MgtC) family protein [Desmospora activa DSM 45169]